MDVLAHAESRLSILSVDGFLSSVAWSVPAAVERYSLPSAGTMLTLPESIIADTPRNNLLAAV